MTLERLAELGLMGLKSRIKLRSGLPISTALERIHQSMYLGVKGHEVKLRSRLGIDWTDKGEVAENLRGWRQRKRLELIENRSLKIVSEIDQNRGLSRSSSETFCEDCGQVYLKTVRRLVVRFDPESGEVLRLSCNSCAMLAAEVRRYMETDGRMLDVSKLIGAAEQYSFHEDSGRCTSKIAFDPDEFKRLRYFSGTSISRLGWLLDLHKQTVIRYGKGRPVSLTRAATLIGIMLPQVSSVDPDSAAGILREWDRVALCECSGNRYARFVDTYGAKWLHL